MGCTSMTSPVGTSASSFLANGWESSRTLPNGVTTQYAYNPIGLPTHIETMAGSTALSNYTNFAYDGVMNLTGVRDADNAGNSTGASSFSYDFKNRLTGETSTKAGGYSNSFAYDDAGNPTTFKGVGQTFNKDNQVSATGFAFDANGNPTTYARSTFTYDQENRVTGIGSTLTAQYRSDGLRGWKQNASGKTYCFYDGGEPVERLTSAYTGTATNKKTIRFLTTSAERPHVHWLFGCGGLWLPSGVGSDGITKHVHPHRPNVRSRHNRIREERDS